MRSQKGANQKERESTTRNDDRGNEKSDHERRAEAEISVADGGGGI